MENSSGQTNPNLAPLPLLQPPYLVLPPTGVDQPAGPRIKNWRDLGSEHRKGKKKNPVVCQLSQGEDEDIRQLPTVVISSQSKGIENAWTDWSCGKTTCWRRFVTRTKMVPEEICCLRGYVAWGDMLPEEIPCWRYLAKEYLAKEYPAKEYPAKGVTHHWVQIFVSWL